MSGQLQQTVLEALDKEDPNVLRAACLMSGELKIAQAERGLLKALNNQAWQVQAEAAKSLGLIQAKGALPYLRRLLKASEGDLRQKMLAAAGGAPPAEGEETHPAVLKAAALAINRIQPSVAEDVLVGALASDNPKVMGAAMAGLATLDSEKGRERMVELLGNEDLSLRKGAAACLGKLKDKSALSGLLALLRDDDSSVRKEAVIALNHIKDKRTLPPMISLMKDPDAEVRRVTAIALGNTRQRKGEVVDALIEALKDRDAQVRKACLSALGNLKAGQALEAAAELMAESHEDVATQAAVTVTLLGVARHTPDYQD
ncbi:HEAT repeat domain-containing protein [Dethiosulfatarculus sandiegensis]|uniref:PBS lyase n=1 Tax=Dethiosulfatarculus sandiegensis TaxID=1429043 RepID=A0A0D2JKD4_9BACT|nr:HEAT repeat domain-containing protein [Dethiosulfatarculus sandiegensis]KIX16111.1 hypothetical protein X474_01355 [Dethiosulfatarculus sandiegensis]